jgi:hypothetical protein
MDADLSPDVRASATEALRHKLRGVIPAIWLIDGEIWTEAIDAVVVVLAPQIARPLQARIEELEDENAAARRFLDDERTANRYQDARVEQLTAALTEIAAQHRHYVEGYCVDDSSLNDRDEWCFSCQARAALTGFVMSYEEMGLDESPETAELIEKARAALAAGKTESEHDPRCASLTPYGQSQRWCDCSTWTLIDEHKAAGKTESEDKK